MPETYTVQVNGQTVTKTLPDGLSDEQIRAAFGLPTSPVQRTGGMAFANQAANALASAATAIAPHAAAPVNALAAASEAVPSNIALYLSTLLGSREPITNSNLAAADIEALRAAAINALKGGENAIGYEHYPTTTDKDLDSKGWTHALVNSFTDPHWRAATTVGQGRLEQDAQGNVYVVDTYDFNSGQQLNHLLSQPGGQRILNSLSRPTEALDFLGALLAPQEANKRRPVRINLGPLPQEEP